MFVCRGTQCQPKKGMEHFFTSKMASIIRLVMTLKSSLAERSSLAVSIESRCKTAFELQREGSTNHKAMPFLFLLSYFEHKEMHFPHVRSVS